MAAERLDAAKPQECYICHRPENGPGEVWCSRPHPFTRNAAWRSCDDCRAYAHAHTFAILHACASVGLERRWTTNRMIDFYMEERHAKHADKEDAQ